MWGASAAGGLVCHAIRVWGWSSGSPGDSVFGGDANATLSLTPLPLPLLVVHTARPGGGARLRLKPPPGVMSCGGGGGDELESLRWTGGGGGDATPVSPCPGELLTPSQRGVMALAPTTASAAVLFASPRLSLGVSLAMRTTRRSFLRRGAVGSFTTVHVSFTLLAQRALRSLACLHLAHAGADVTVCTHHLYAHNVVSPARGRGPVLPATIRI